MDEWLFISLAKTKADAPGFVRRLDGELQKLSSASAPAALTKADTAAALDLSLAAEAPAVRGVTAFLGAALVNAVLLSAIDGEALNAQTPKGEVVVAQLDAQDALPVRAQLSRLQ